MEQILIQLFETFGMAFVAVFVIVDPFAVVPVYLAMTQNETPASRTATRRKATILAFVILSVFALTGMGVFNIFGITLPAFQIAGGILLLFLGLNQLNARRTRMREEEQQEGMEKEDIWVFPLGMPLLAGPGAISTVVLLASKSKNALDLAALIAAIFAALLVSLITLRGAPVLFRVLGKTGINLLTRIMGIILTANSVQFILNGVTGYLKQLNFIQ